MLSTDQERLLLFQTKRFRSAVTAEPDDQTTMPRPLSCLAARYDDLHPHARAELEIPGMAWDRFQLPRRRGWRLERAGKGLRGVIEFRLARARRGGQGGRARLGAPVSRSALSLLPCLLALERAVIRRVLISNAEKINLAPPGPSEQVFPRGLKTDLRGPAPPLSAFESCGRRARDWTGERLSQPP